jgi:hypothetical protein
MWKPNQTGSNTPSTPEPVRPSAPATNFDASPTRPATVGAGTAASAVRVDIRSEGSLTGDVIAARISIEDGAFFKGGIDIRKPGGTDLKGGTATPVSSEPVTVDA